MTTHRRASLVSLALAALTVACGDPAGLDQRASPDRVPFAAKNVPLGDVPLEIAVEYKVESLDDERIRELLEITAYFTGADPVDPETGFPYEDIALNFEQTTTEYKPQDNERSLNGTVTVAWDLEKGRRGYSFEADDPQTVHNAVKIEEFESGQAIADLTGYIAAVEGHLTFNANLKLWELRLGFRGIVTPSDIVTPSMLKTITGSGVATLTIDQTELTARIRENEATFQSPELVLQAETKIQDEGPDDLREVFAAVAHFSSSELQPDPQAPLIEDLQLDFEINFVGVVGPPCLRIVIPGAAWVPGDGGGFAIEEPDWAAAGIKVVVVNDGQIVADLTQEIAAFKAGLRYVPSVKNWELSLEIAGVITPTDIHEPLLAPTAAARLTTLTIGNGLQELFARLREAEGKFR